ncbi:hypothetical protein [Colwellia sp. 20A7]|uniref:hypothetical protein n=1 Tax=Colwellia sp. 20A7 TaxID=2689569 RepID=UPI00135CF28A|nr:hypothetical protein [Colwellia sp. 20A7]
MGIYQIKAQENTYDIIDLDVVVLAEKLAENPTLDEDTLIELLMNLPFDNTSLKSMWPDEMVCNYFGKSKEQNYDINVYANFLVLNMKAYNTLHGELKEFGEFLPLNVEGDKMMMFNLLTFAQENKTLCEMSYLDGFENGLKTLCFDEADTVTKTIFKSKLQGGMTNYCTDKLKHLVEKNDLSGVKFDTDLLDYF